MAGLYLKGIGMMVGMIFGAGIFALPFSFSRAGLFWGLLFFIITFLIMAFLHYLYGEVAYYTRGKHPLAGDVGIFLGKRARHISFITTILSYYGTLLVYGLLGGLFLSNLFGAEKTFIFSLAFFGLVSILLFLNISKIAEINFYLTIPLFCFVLYLLAAALPHIKPANFLANINFGFEGEWFLPYGVWLFSLGGFAVLPETRDLFAKAPIKSFKRVLVASLAISGIFYLIFVAAVWGASNDKTSPEALAGLRQVLGESAFLIGSLIGFLAVFTSFLAMATDMKNIFKLDYGLSFFPSWFLVVAPPAALFLLGATDYVRIISIVGALGLGALGVFIILMARKLRKRIREGDPGDLLKPDNGQYTKPAFMLEALVFIAILAGVAYELWKIFSA